MLVRMQTLLISEKFTTGLCHGGGSVQLFEVEVEKWFNRMAKDHSNKRKRLLGLLFQGIRVYHSSYSSRSGLLVSA